MREAKNSTLAPTQPVVMELLYQMDCCFPDGFYTNNVQSKSINMKYVLHKIIICVPRNSRYAASTVLNSSSLFTGKLKVQEWRFRKGNILK